MKNFLFAYIQVLFVSLNTIFLAKNNPSMVFVCAFIISYIWSHNVKKVAFGTELDKIIYSVGASLGSISGLFISTYIL
jgi:hypothetical protein